MAPMNPKCIVVFKPDTPQTEIDRHMQGITSSGGTITNIYDTVFKGFAAVIPEGYMGYLNSLTAPNGPIDYIENDGMVTIQTY